MPPSLNRLLHRSPTPSIDLGVAASHLSVRVQLPHRTNLLIEMEASTLYVLASMLRVRAGGIMVMHGEGELGSLEPLIETAVLALRELIKGDQNAQR